MNAQVMYFHRFEVTTYAARFDVDHLTRADQDGIVSIGWRSDRFVQADRCFDALGEFCVPREIVVRQRLLKEKKPKRIELRQVSDITNPVGAVGVNLQQNIGKSFPHRGHLSNVITWFNFQLYSSISLRNIALNGVKKGSQRIAYSDGHTGRY